MYWLHKANQLMWPKLIGPLLENWFAFRPIKPECCKPISYCLEDYRSWLMDEVINLPHVAIPFLSNAPLIDDNRLLVCLIFLGIISLILCIVVIIYIFIVSRKIDSDISRWRYPVPRYHHSQVPTTMSTNREPSIDSPMDHFRDPRVEIMV